MNKLVWWRLSRKEQQVKSSNSVTASVSVRGCGSLLLLLQRKAYGLGFVRQDPAHLSKGNTDKTSASETKRWALSRALQSARHQLAAQWEWQRNAKNVEDERCKSRITVAFCWGARLCGQVCIRFTSSPKLASPKLYKRCVTLHFFFSHQQLIQVTVD